MGKTVITIGLVVVFGAIVLGAIVLSRSGGDESPAGTNATSSPGNISFPSSQSSGAPSTRPVANGDTLALKTVDGGFVQAKNIKKDPELAADPNNPGYYYLGFNQLGSKADSQPPYVIGFIEETQYFNISLLQKPLGKTRADAERYLMARLGLSPSDMCRLEYMVSVPYDVDDTYTGASLGFSFCSDAVQLP